MSTPTDPREPLTPEEAALAQSLRQLPAGEPPGRVDARILGAAANALGSRRRPRRRYGLWAVGTAAAAVLAVGVVWRLQHEIVPLAPDEEAATMSAPAEAEAVRQDAAAQTTPAEAAADTAAAKTAADAARESTERRRVEPLRSPAAPPPTTARREQPKPAFVPEPVPAAPVLPEEPAPTVSAPPVPSPSSEVLARSAAAPAPAPPPAPAPAAAPSPTATVQTEAFVADEAGAAAGTVMPPVEDDAQLAPIDWLKRIRARLAAGDTYGARASLAAFQEAHPKIALPDDLEPLLRE